MDRFGVVDGLLESFSGIEDPRIDRRKLYPIAEILFLAVLGALLGVESWRGLEILGNNKIDFLRNYFPYKEGIPSHQTLGRVFSLIKPRSFEQFFTLWAQHFDPAYVGRMIAIDGKTLKRSYDKDAGKKALHLLNACAVENGICLAQLEVDSKTNEIKAVPELLKDLDIKGAIISMDALNTQKEITDIIHNAKADYTLALKGNHKHLFEEVQYMFSKETDTSLERPRCENTEKSNGRITTRKYELISNLSHLGHLTNEWKGLKAIGRVRSNSFKKGKETSEERYYLLSYDSISTFAASARGHWGVENKIHWTLDVTFKEDASRKRKDHAPRNFALVRKFALNIARKAKGKLSIPGSQIAGLTSDQFLTTMLHAGGFEPKPHLST